jgi:hypothetical protein
MRLRRLHVRFFRSFNFDYERKAHRDAEPKDWEMIDGAWYPFVRVDLDPAVTAVVGANESGKSHLIDALKKALTGEGISRSDFCRYSALFSVETGQVRLPDLGVEFELEDEDDLAVAAKAGIPAEIGRPQILLRLGGVDAAIVDSSGEALHLPKRQLEALTAALPKPIQLATDVPLPDSISLDDLLGRRATALSKRKRRFALVDAFRGVKATEEAIAGKAAVIAAALSSADGGSDDAGGGPTSADLGRRLLLDVAHIDKSSFEDLEEALREGLEGRVGGLIEEMNRSLSRHLNFGRWWRQDRDFALRLAPRERELVFTIRDRTGRDYSFSERSRGLTYFLSYFVQLKAHQQDGSIREVLLMDEPDAYLSSAGQQDLLRALEDFARPDDASRADQVVYVTHSPFLINKNAAHRIRVIDKGTNEEGTRVVRDVARNHYEPLRSSVGSFVAETAFISGSNLVVEGLADQVILAGATSLLRRLGSAPNQLLDLNEVTIVPAGSADSVPYIVYLARGRDEVKPACVALLDGDKAGQDAQRKLARSDDGKRRRILAEAFVVNLSTWAKSAELVLDDAVAIREIEDLLPLEIVARSAQGYAVRLLEFTSGEAAKLKAENVAAELAAAEGRVFRALQAAFATAFHGAHIEKVGFAKEVVSLLEAAALTHEETIGVADFRVNFGALIGELSVRLRRAQAEESERRNRNRTDRLVRSFFRDHPDASSRDAADALLRDLEASLEDSVGDQAVVAELHALRRDFSLGAEPLTPLSGFAEFRLRLDNLASVRREAYREKHRGAEAVAIDA